MVFKFLITFSVGVYSGIYLAQNYNVPKVDEPKELVNKAKKFFNEMSEKYKKDNGDDR